MRKESARSQEQFARNFISVLKCLNPVSSKRVGGLEEHPAHSAHVEEVVARPALADVARGGGVSPAPGTGLPQQPDVALLPPGGAPAVPHDPEVRPVLRAVADQLDAVVELDVVVVVAAGEDAAVVVFEGAGSHRYRERTNLVISLFYKSC